METKQEPRTKEEIRARVDEIKGRLRELDSEHAGEFIDPESDEGQEWRSLNEELDDREQTLTQLEAREQRLQQIAGSDRNREAGAEFGARRGGVARGEDIFDLSTVRASLSNPEEQKRELHERANRLVESARPKHPDFDPDDGRRHAEWLLQFDSDDGRLARYYLSVGSPTYKRAFGKALAYGGNLVMLSREEQQAIVQAQMAERALSMTGAQGGFAVPFELDPTILNTSNGVVNPIRAISRVEQITVDEWRGISSTGITASYAAEATETTDNAPTLAQPTVSTEKAQAWVPFSIEIGQDWSNLQGQMASLLQEAKDILEAAKFISGTGTNEPFGVATGTTNTVNAATGQTFTLANLYALRAALPPRYRARGSFVGDLLTFDRVRQFDTVGSSAAIWVDSLQDDNPPRLLGRPAYEASEMPDTPATGNKFLIYGDFSRYLIAERVGLGVELVPHVFGANQRPTGQRGIYAYWRNGARVLDANAFRALIGVV